MIKLSNVFKEYKLDGEIFAAVKNINLSINKGEFIAILGPSGSGKSTLMHLIGLLDNPTRGTICVEGKDVSKLSDSQLSLLRNEFVGFVFQQFNLINKLTVLENILLPTIYSKQKFSASPEERAFSLMERFGIKEKATSYPNKLSGGQQQRVAITRALINNPKVILADEPTGNLDTKTGDKILTLLTELNREDKITVILVTHEADVAVRAKRKIQIRDGEIVKS
ncbi:ABC transporter ATP-binding protein [Candidatus Gottesmanbacteria bacterium]|nr:ABC transporter ATP-binding protein [Candidatus Gottesmanbacteria bacterium]